MGKEAVSLRANINKSGGGRVTPDAVLYNEMRGKLRE
jgi:hypothetical protein